MNNQRNAEKESNRPTKSRVILLFAVVALLISGALVVHVIRQNEAQRDVWKAVAASFQAENLGLKFENLILELEKVKLEAQKEIHLNDFVISSVSEEITIYKVELLANLLEDCQMTVDDLRAFVATQFRIVVVRPGEWLSTIADEFLGDSFRWQDIAKVNHLVNPDLIYPRMILQLPPDSRQEIKRDNSHSRKKSPYIIF